MRSLRQGVIKTIYVPMNKLKLFDRLEYIKNKKFYKKSVSELIIIAIEKFIKEYE